MNGFACMVVVFFAFSAALLQGALAAVYVVGDGTGWAIPPNGADTYTNWASDKFFRVGDTIVFNFVTNVHDVLQVPRASYDACSSNNAIGSIFTNGPANVTFNYAGDRYYICTFRGHCAAGQKLAISVHSLPTPEGDIPPTKSPAPTTPNTCNQPTAACAPTPSPAATPTAATTTPPPPPPSSSNALFASLGFAIASVAVGLFV